MPPHNDLVDSHWWNPTNAIQVIRGDTKTAVFPITGLRLAACSSCFQASFRFWVAEIRNASSSLKWAWQERKSFSSISKNIFLILWVRLTTAGFQWLWTFLSRAGNIMGRITWRLWAIKLTMWSLFHKKRALSATWNNPCSTEKRKCVTSKLLRNSHHMKIAYMTDA